MAQLPDKENSLHLSSVPRDSIGSGGNSTSSPYNVDREEVPPGTIARRGRGIKFREEEVTFLEDWYELVERARPDDCVLQVIADACNSISSRSEPNIIAGKNVFN